MAIMPNLTVPESCELLQKFQRQRAIVIKSRIMQANRLQAIVAGTIGYNTDMTEAERAKKFAEATNVIDQIDDGELTHPLGDIVQTTLVGIRAFEEKQAEIETEMRKVARRLPIRQWLEHKDQNGVSIQYLGVIIGETGDLALYANPAKVWRRLGCAPWSYEGQTKMGATWRGKKKGDPGKLPREEWTLFGYSPRRRSVSYLIGEGIVKQNGEGPYRTRYLEAKVKARAAHPEWEWGPCTKCKGNSPEDCTTCGGTGEKCLHGHRHGMLLSTKLFLKNLWIEWNGHPPQGSV